MWWPSLLWLRNVIYCGKHFGKVQLLGNVKVPSRRQQHYCASDQSKVIYTGIGIEGFVVRTVHLRTEKEEEESSLVHYSCLKLLWNDWNTLLFTTFIQALIYWMPHLPDEYIYITLFNYLLYSHKNYNSEFQRKWKTARTFRRAFRFEWLGLGYSGHCFLWLQTIRFFLFVCFFTRMLHKKWWSKSMSNWAKSHSPFTGLKSFPNPSWLSKQPRAGN